MSTADKLGKVLETKLAIKGAITEKGVAVLDTDTFASYPDKIRAIQTGGGSASGGTKKFVTNSTTNTYNEGDRVLVNLGLHPKTDLNYGKDLANTGTYPYDRGNVFTDNENAFVWFVDNGKRKYTFSNDQWTATDIKSWENPYTSGFILHKNGTVNMNSINAYTASGALLYNTACVPTTDDYRYLGSYNGKDYAIFTNGNKINNYVLSTNTIDTSTTLLDMADNTTVAYLDDDTGVGFSISTNKLVDFFYVNDEGTFSYFGARTINIPNDTYLVTFTGSGVGDYLLFATNWNNKYGNNNNTSGKSYLIIYKIVENGTGGRTIELATDVLKQFQTGDCLAQFDLRNDVLTVGTRDNVYAYKFNRETMSFEQLPYKFDLTPNTLNTFCYRLSFSPDLSKAIVTLRSTANDMRVTLYVLGDTKWEIVDNQVFNYNSTTSYIGYATGNVDEDGKVEVEMLLPDEVDIQVETNVDVNESEIIFEGN
jgi:hypothetical protein